MEKSDIECISVRQPRAVARSAVRKESISLTLGVVMPDFRTVFHDPFPNG